MVSQVGKEVSIIGIKEGGESKGTDVGVAIRDESRETAGPDRVIAFFSGLAAEEGKVLDCLELGHRAGQIIVEFDGPMEIDFEGAKFQAR